jgi:hypothetical protein
MNEDSTALHVHPDDTRSLALGTEFNFMYTFSNPSFFVDGGTWSVGHQFGLGNVINFTQIENLSFFELNGVMEIGFIGGINGNDSELYINAFADYDDPDAGNNRYLLYDYGGDSQTSYSVRLDSGITQTDLVFEHVNQGEPGSSVFQSDPDRFKLFAGVNPDGSMTGEYLITVSDVDEGLNNGSGLGIFYMIEGVSPVVVPESSNFGLILSVMLGVAVGMRRLRKSLKAIW